MATNADAIRAVPMIPAEAVSIPRRAMPVLSAVNGAITRAGMKVHALRISPGHRNGPAIYRLAVHERDGVAGCPWIGEGHEAEATAASRVPLGDDLQQENKVLSGEHDQKNFYNGKLCGPDNPYSKM
jgi:hypothetical protein